MLNTTVKGLWNAINSKEKELSKHLSYGVKVDFGFYSMDNKHHRILLDLYRDMICNCEVTLDDLQYFASEGLLQQFVEKIYPTTTSELKVMAGCTFPNGIASIISEYGCTSVWDEFLIRGLKIENPHGDMLSFTSKDSL